MVDRQALGSAALHAPTITLNDLLFLTRTERWSMLIGKPRRIGAECRNLRLHNAAAFGRGGRDAKVRRTRIGMGARDRVDPAGCGAGSATPSEAWGIQPSPCDMSPVALGQGRQRV